MIAIINIAIIEIHCWMVDASRIREGGTYFLLEHVEIVYDDTNEEVEGEESPTNDEYNEVQIGP